MSELHTFVFDGLPVRGSLVRLTDGWREALARRSERQPRPDEVVSLVGQMCAAGVLMQSNIKFDGALILQLAGDGPVKLAVAEVQSDLSFRGTATLVGEVPAGAQIEAMANVGGSGRCAITLDPRQRLPGQQPYQGVVALHGDRREPLQQLSEVLEHYMLQSEQLDTRLVLAADTRVAAGLLIQRLPVEGAGNLDSSRNEDDIGLSEGFNRVALLAATLTPAELLMLDSDDLLRRLFWQEHLIRFVPLQPRFACTCSRDRVRAMLLSLGQAESESLIEERGEVEVGCEFCGRLYRFDAVDVGKLFTAPLRQAPGSTSVN